MSQKDAKGEMTFGPDVALRFWQQSTTRMMRANERLIRGMTDMANCQVEWVRHSYSTNWTRLSLVQPTVAPQILQVCM